MAVSEGSLLGGRYELGEELGFGGMATVLRGRDIRLGRDVAVKILRPELARDPSFQNRFRREAQSAAALNHPAIVAVYDTGEDDGTPYIVMEYVEGRTLRQVLGDEGRLAPRRGLEIAAEVAAALEYSHRAGIVHRDIKPGNVMLTRTGDVKVMDFGIARAATASSSTMTETASVLGTAQYLSPEQARGEHVDARSDVYSLGCLLYELVTGIPPFQGESAVAVAYQHVREDPVPPSSVDTELPTSIDAVVLKAMAKNPANRYQSAGEFQADLERAAAGRRVSATSVLADQATTALGGAAVVGSTTVMMRPDRDQRSGRRRAAYALLLLAVLGVFLVAALLFRSLFSGGGRSVATPPLHGLTVAQARLALAAKGLHIGKIEQHYTNQDPADDQPAGHIYDQSPLDGFSTNAGSAVDVKVSLGIQMVQVPNVVGKSLADAQAAINAAHLTLGTVQRSDVPGTPGTVLAVDPKAGTTLRAGAAVSVTVVSGMQQVPNVLNEDVNQASQLLSADGFKVVTNFVNSDKPANTVLTESPPGGSTQPTGTTITLTVSNGSPPPTPTPTPTPTTSPSTSPTPTVSTTLSP